MEYTRLGNTGLLVSRLALGCMSYGDPTTAGAHGWALDDEDAQPFFRQAVELGITFWDTANVYQRGTSEELVGRAINRYSRREDIVLATKVYGRMHDGPGGQGLSRKAILEQVDASLTRLGTDYIDLYQIHRFDPDTPVEETMEALHDVVKAGKVRYLGASSHVRLAVRQAPARRRPRRLDPVRVHAEPVQPAPPPRRAGADGHVRRHGRGPRAVLPPGQGPARAPVGRAVPPLQPSTTSSSRSTRLSTSPSSTPSRRSPRPAASAWPRSRWPGCCTTRSSPPRSWEQPSRITCPRPSRPWTCTSPTTRADALEEPYTPHGPSWF